MTRRARGVVAAAAARVAVPRVPVDRSNPPWEEGEMPLWFYVPLHPEARPSDADRSGLRGWAIGSAGE